MLLVGHRGSGRQRRFPGCIVEGLRPTLRGLLDDLGDISGATVIVGVSGQRDVLAHDDTPSPDECDGDADPDDEELQEVRCETTMPIRTCPNPENEPDAWTTWTRR